MASERRSEPLEPGDEFPGYEMNCEFCRASVATNDAQCPHCGGPVKLVRRKDPTRITLLAGTEVLARSRDGSWVRGEILELRQEGEVVVYRVARKGKEPRWMAREEITVDGDPPADIDQAYEAGDRVCCRTPDGSWINGTVGASYGRVYRIDFDNEEVAWLHPDHIRFVEPASAYGRRRAVRLALAGVAVLVVVLGLVSAFTWGESRTEFSVREAQLENENVPPDLPPPVLRGVTSLPPRGTLVLVRDAGLDQCILGRVASGLQPDATASIQFLDGRVAPHPLKDLFHDVVIPGCRVDGRGEDGAWHRGTVRQRGTEDALVMFDDGTRERLPLDAIRVRCR